MSTLSYVTQYFWREILYFIADNTVVFYFFVFLLNELILGHHLDIINMHLLESRLYHIYKRMSKLYKENLRIGVLLSDF